MAKRNKARGGFGGDPLKHFFVVCEKCENKIFVHKGFIFVKGLFTFAVECPLCGEGFNHRMMTEKAHIKEQRQKMLKTINPEAIRDVANKIMGGGF